MKKLMYSMLIVGAVCSACATSDTHEEPTNESASTQEVGRAALWAADDEVGMGNTQGYATRLRCALELVRPRAKVYELAHLVSNTMPQSPFSAPVSYTFRPTNFMAGTAHIFNGEAVAGELAHQGTQFDALGHFGYLSAPWDGTSAQPLDDIRYYNGFTQADVKPTPDSPLLKLGVDKAPPIVTSGVFLDAMTHLNGGNILPPGFAITASHIQTLLQAHGLQHRGILPGDAIFIRTGWQKLRAGGGWQDPMVDSNYYRFGPGLAYSGVRYLETKKVVLIALDNPFTDPVNEGQLQGQAPPPAECPPGLPFCIHHYTLAKAGIYQIQNANLSAIVDDGVTTACTMILPLRTQGGTGSPVRPIAVGVPHDD